MFSPIEEIKSRIDIVELIQSYVRLQKAGVNYKANCPFHAEKTPSFFVTPARQIWHCFGCSRGGDHFKFVMEIEGQDFPEALRLLAQRAGVVLKREDPAISSERNRLYDVCEEASQIFEKSLSLTPAAQVYLKKRGLKDETIKEFRVGFAPQSWDFLLKALAQKGFKKEEVEKAGLVIKSEDKSSFYDRFRSRIMFPISDANGRIVGFSGRIFEQPVINKSQSTTEAKYVNTPNTLIYDKSRILYGFDRAKQDIRAKNEVVVVEGQMDCTMSHQAGVKNTIAVSGTALTPFQLNILKRLCGTILSSFDTDSAGDSATKRSLALASQFEFERKIVAIPSGKDPADTILENPKLWIDTVSNAKGVIEFYFEKAFRENDSKSVQGKKEISAIVLPLVAELANEIEKSHWVGEVARGLNAPEEKVWQELKRYESKSSNRSALGGAQSREPFGSAFGGEKGHRPPRKELLEERFLTLLAVINNEAAMNELKNRHFVFTSSLRQELFGALKSGAVADLTPHLKDQLDILKLKGEMVSQMTKDVQEEFTQCIRELEKEHIKERLAEIGEEIQQKEKEGKAELVNPLLQDFKDLSEKLKILS